jgi:hypothetical protein
MNGALQVLVRYGYVMLSSPSCWRSRSAFRFPRCRPCSASWRSPARAAALGHYALVIVGAALASYVTYEFVQRQRFLRSLRIARISPEEVTRRIDAGDPDLAIIDTRSALDVRAMPFGIRGAIWIAAEEIERRHREVPRDRDIVLYGT